MNKDIDLISFGILLKKIDSTLNENDIELVINKYFL